MPFIVLETTKKGHAESAFHDLLWTVAACLLGLTTPHPIALGGLLLRVCLDLHLTLLLWEDCCSLLGLTTPHPIALGGLLLRVCLDLQHLTLLLWEDTCLLGLDPIALGGLLQSAWTYNTSPYCFGRTFADLQHLTFLRTPQTLCSPVPSISEAALLHRRLAVGSSCGSKYLPSIQSHQF